MTTQSAPKQERLQSRQGDFDVLPLTTNGGGVGRIPPDQEIGEPTTTSVVPGALVVFSRFGEFRMMVNVQFESLSDGSLKSRFSDEAGTLGLEFHMSSSATIGNLNINTQYTDKPLDAARRTAQFFKTMATVPGQLFFEIHEPKFATYHAAELPLAVPEFALQEHLNRLRLLEGLHEIRINTGVEIRYPADTDDEEGLANFNFVLMAIRGGWVAQQITGFPTPIPTEVDTLLEEFRKEGQVLRAFYFELPNETYMVFGKEVKLGPSRRYIAAARLATTQEEIETWLSQESEYKDALPLRWESVNDTPMHVFFEDWPKSSLESVKRELREFETVYGTSSERFKQAWEQDEAWTKEIQDGNRWFSLIQAREELAQET